MEQTLNTQSYETFMGKFLLFTTDCRYAACE